MKKEEEMGKERGKGIEKQILVLGTTVALVSYVRLLGTSLLGTI